MAYISATYMIDGRVMVVIEHCSDAAELAERVIRLSAISGVKLAVMEFKTKLWQNIN